MKLYKFPVMALAAVALSLGSCSDKGYWEGYQPEGVEYAIITSNSTVTLTADKPTASPVTITFSRGTTVGEQTVPVVLSTDSPLVVPTGASTLTFADGSSEAFYTVGFTTDFMNVPLFNPEAVVTVALGDVTMSPSSAATWKAKITFENSDMLGEATLKSQLLSYKANGGTPGAATVEEAVRVCTLKETSLLVFEAPYSEGNDVMLVLDSEFSYVDWDATNLFGYQPLFEDPVKGMVYLLWDEAATTVSAHEIVMSFMAVTLDADNNPEPYDADAFTWTETYEMPAGWNE